jgi:hypothetical protein
MAGDEDLQLPPVRSQNLLSEEERDLLTTLAGEHDLRFEELSALIEHERSLQGMGRRPNIHLWIQSHIAEIAKRRLGKD